MITLKVLYIGGSEQVFEVKRYGYDARNKKINFHIADGDAGEIPLSGSDIVVAYAMNSAGSTVGKYYNSKAQ